ncbi:alpha/beta hydrolase-fold protein [Armatimonas sp.]|uniref:alpha/beta hydrolase-fold protein n=1 Tax=Armatimonas sp. TaxID=1872638 RepID=UPI0037538C7B
MRTLAFSLLTLAALCTTPAVALAQNVYPLTPDSQPQDGVPKGRSESSKFTSTKWFPGTVRDMRLYIPAQYDSKKPACVLVMQDGGGFRDTTVLDNLIAKGEIPVIIGIFITPGVVPPTSPSALPRYNRSYEYDSPTDRYAKFLIDEVVPEVGKKYNLSKDPNDHAIAGGSSGGIAAFTAAFFRPDAFRRVISFIGSYTDLRGATNYGALVRKFEPKPIRIFQQDGKNDQDIYSGSWPIGNTDLAAGLKFGRYEAMMTWGEGQHDGVQSTALFPDALRFVWKGWPAPVGVATDTPQPITKIVTADEKWKLILLAPIDRGSEAQSISTASDGRVYVGLSGAITHFPAEEGELHPSVGDSNAMIFSPDGRLILAQNKQVVALDVKTGKKISLGKFGARGVVVGKNRNAYFTSSNGSIWLVPADTKLKPKIVGNVPDASGITLVPDQTLLMVSSATERYIHAFVIQTDGSLAHQQPYHEVYVNHGETKSNAGGMVTDTNGWLYVASPFGIQVLDQAGRVNGIIVNPTTEPTTQLAWSGSTLYALTKDGKVYARKTKATGVQAFADPIKPPAPRL